MQILSQKDMQNKSISERNLPFWSSTNEINDNLLQEYECDNSDFDPLFINNEQSNVNDGKI